MHESIGGYSANKILQQTEVNRTFVTDGKGSGRCVVRAVRANLVSDSWRLRMEHEVERLCQIDSPYYIQPLEAGNDQHWAWVKYGWREGRTLSQQLHAKDACFSSQCQRVNSVLTLAESLLQGLCSVHAAGFVQRDLRPSHIVETSPSVYALGGYGPICVAGAFGSQGSQAIEFAGYASPELSGSIEHDLTPASDLYSLGLILFTSLVGKVPFNGKDVGEILFQHLTQTPGFEGVPAATPDLVLQLITRMLEKEVRDRYQSAESALADVRSIQEALAGRESFKQVTIGRFDRRSELTEPSFVGRQQEMGVINDEIDQVAKGKQRTLVVVGKSGMGKSRLLLEAIRVATRRGFNVYRSVATDQATQEPLGPLLTVVDSFARHLSYNREDALKTKADLAEFEGEICTAMPSLARALGWTESTLSGPEELGQGRIQAAFCRVLEASAFSSPTLICIDDCQWLDRSSLRVLEEFASIRHRKILLMVGSRPQEGMSDELIGGLQGAELLEFGELSLGGIHALIESMAGQLPEEIKQSVAAMSAGSPFLATAAMRGLVESQALLPVAGGWRVDHERLTDFQAAGDSASVLLKRLQFVDQEAFHLLSIGAVIGKQFEIDIPLNLTGMAADQAFSKLKRVRDQGLIWGKPDGCIAFVHDKIREAVVSTIDGDTRCNLHRQVAEYLLEHRPDRCFDLAYHFDAAALPQRAWRHALKAGGLARQRYALDTAENQYRIACRAIDPARQDFDESEQLNQASQHSMELGLAKVLILLGKYEEADGWLCRALQTAPTAMDEAKVRFKQGDLAFKRGDKEQALKRFEQALKDAGHEVPTSKLAFFASLTKELMVQILHSLLPRLLTGHRATPKESERLTWKLYSKVGHCYWYVRDKYYTLWAHLRELNAAEKYEPTLELAQAYSEHAPVMSLIPWQKRGLDYARRSLTIRNAMQDLWGVGQSRNFLSIMFYSGARFQEAINQAQQAISVLERTGDYWEIHMAQYQAAASLYRLGQLKDAADAARALYESGVKRGDHQSSSNALDLWARASLGRVPAEVMARESVKELRDHQGRCQMWLAEGVQYHLAGRFDEAIECFQSAVSAVKKTGVLNTYITPNYAWLATALRGKFQAHPPLLEKKRKESIQRMHRAARRAVFVSYRFRNELPHALRELAAVEAIRGNFAKALRLLKRSVKVAKTQGAAYEQAQSELMRTQLEAEWLKNVDQEIELTSALNAVASFEESVVDEAATTSLSLMDRFEVLLDAGREVTAANNTQEILKRTLGATQRLLRASRVLLLQRTVNRNANLGWEIIEPIGSSEAFDAEIVERAVEAGTNVIEQVEILKRHGMSFEQSSAVLACPIVVNQRVRYVLYVANQHVLNLFREDESRIATFLSSTASGALERAEGFAQLKLLNENLEQRVQDRTRAVLQRSLELEQTADELRKTQVELEDAKTAAEQASAAKSDFLACMSHEIRTPMSAVLGFTEVLRTRDVNQEEQEGYLRRIHTNGQHLLALLNDVLDFSRIEAQRLQVERISCNTMDIVSDAVSALLPRAEEKGLDLSVNIQGEIPEFIKTDPTRLRQIIINLVGNAIKFTAHGNIRIDLGLEQNNRVPLLKLSVKDSGIGIAPNQIDRIFEPFTQADETTSRQFGGTGLGLSISKRLADVLGGSLEVESEVGIGSVFTLRVDTGPLEEVAMISRVVEAPLQPSPPEKGEDVGRVLHGRCALVVDDVEANRELIGFLLREAGADVRFACNGQEAIDLVCAEPQIDLVLMDMQMPVLDGYSATKTLRGSGHELPIIAMTANNLLGDQDKCLAAGCTDFIPKPVDFETLIAKAAKYSADTRLHEESVETTAAAMLGVVPTETEDEVQDTSELAEESLDEVMTRLGGEFLEDVERRWDELESAVQNEDLATLKQLAHWIKGTGGTFGFKEIESCMVQIEEAVHQGENQRIESLFADFSEEYTKARRSTGNFPH